MLFADVFASFTLLPLAEILRGALLLALLVRVLVFFRPLLTGLVRAFVLIVRPRRTGARA